MAGNLKDEIKMENIEIKEKIQENILPSSTLEETCTVYIKEEDIKVEITKTKGKNILFIGFFNVKPFFFLLNFVFIFLKNFFVLQK